MKMSPTFLSPLQEISEANFVSLFIYLFLFNIQKLKRN